jgi:hypothetical protein
MVTAALALALREWSVDIATVLMRMRGCHGRVKFQEKPFQSDLGIRRQLD